MTNRSANLTESAQPPEVPELSGHDTPLGITAVTPRDLHKAIAHTGGSW